MNHPFASKGLLPRAPLLDALPIMSAGADATRANGAHNLPLMLAPASALGT